MSKPKDVAARNIALSGKVMRYLMANPQAFELLPDNFELVLLPENDLELQEYNLTLLNQIEPISKPVVFARLSSAQNGRQISTVNFYTPVTV